MKNVPNCPKWRENLLKQFFENVDPPNDSIDWVQIIWQQMENICPNWQENWRKKFFEMFEPSPIFMKSGGQQIFGYKWKK